MLFNIDSVIDVLLSNEDDDSSNNNNVFSCDNSSMFITDNIIEYYNNINGDKDCDNALDVLFNIIQGNSTISSTNNRKIVNNERSDGKCYDICKYHNVMFDALLNYAINNNDPINYKNDINTDYLNILINNSLNFRLKGIITSRGKYIICNGKIELALDMINRNIHWIITYLLHNSLFHLLNANHIQDIMKSYNVHNRIHTNSNYTSDNNIHISDLYVVNHSNDNTDKDNVMNADIMMLSEQVIKFVKQFLLELLLKENKASRPYSVAWQKLISLRLYFSCMRRSVLSVYGDSEHIWNILENGVPINQHILSDAIALFMIGTIRALELLVTGFNQEHKLCVIHLWYVCIYDVCSVNILLCI
jgi:hypothetical protein